MSRKPLLELCCETMRHATVPLPQIIEGAARAGFEAITVNPRLVREAGVDQKALGAQLRDAGLIVTNIDGFASGLPGGPEGEALIPYRNFIASGATPGGGQALATYFPARDVTDALLAPEEDFYRIADNLGASSINMLHFGRDPDTPLAEIVDATGPICQRAAARGLEIVVEFIPGCGISSLLIGAALVEKVRASNLGLVFDSRHWARSGGTIEQLMQHAGKVGAIQLSDLNWATRDDPERLLLGEGDLLLKEAYQIIRKARPDVPIGFEVMNGPLFAMPPDQIARTAYANLRSFIEDADRTCI